MVDIVGRHQPEGRVTGSTIARWWRTRGLTTPGAPKSWPCGGRRRGRRSYGAVQVGGGLTVFTLGARNVPAAELTLLSLTELALAPVWVWLAVGEVPSASTLLGGAVIIGAITYQALSGTRRRPLPMV